jgi:hypothetical protein
MPAPRLAGAVLCAAASFMLMLSSVRLYAGEAGFWGAGLLLLIGLWLLWVAVRTLRSARASQ